MSDNVSIRFSQSVAQKRPFNPFTAKLSAPSLLKRPIKVPNLKSFRTFFRFACACEKISIKRLSAQRRLFTDPSNILFFRRVYNYMQIFSPEILPAGAVKGLIIIYTKNVLFSLFLREEERVIFRGTCVAC